MRIADELEVDCPVFYIDNVAQYIKDLGGLDLNRDLPLCTPPFPDMFIEYRVKWNSFPVDTKEGFRLVTEDAGEMAKKKHPDSRWVVCSHQWFGPASASSSSSPVELTLFIAEDGRLLAVESLIDREIAVRMADDVREAASQAHLKAILSPLLAISFMHCKNVRHVEHAPKTSTFWRAAGNKKKAATLRYYTLEIDPMKETLRREGNIETVGLARALHICRGHFKDYRQSGLFGKIKGIFWWGPALRGSPEHGQVVKDYAVKAPPTPDTVH